MRELQSTRGRYTISMRYLLLLVLIFVLSGASSAGAPSPPLSVIMDIDLLMEHAMSQRLIAGGVVLIGARNGAVFQRAYGRMSADPFAPPMRTDAIFDVASLTKVVATTSAIMKLVEDGKVSVNDPVATWFSEFGETKKKLLIKHLMTHTSGIIDFPLTQPDPLNQAVERCATRPSRGDIGHSFCYSDLNFILLGDLVRRVSGVPLDRYVAERIFVPLGMLDTSFSPPPAARPRLSATVLPDGALLTGAPQDGLARQLGGVAGHAGLFSTAADLALFCRMLMNGGEIDGRRVLTERTVVEMTAPRYLEGGKVVRGLGWDIASPYSAPRGHGFSESSFGHTGYSGASLWIDPLQDLFVVLLTARIDFSRTGDFNRLRRDLSTLAATTLAPSGRIHSTAGIF